MGQPYDLPLEELYTYIPELTKEADFADFWKQSLEELAGVPLEVQTFPYDYPVDGLKVFRVEFKSFNHAIIEAWLAYPEQEGPLPGIMRYHGYNWAADGNVHETVDLALKGYAVLQMMTRGQQGNSTDNVVSPQGYTAGWMTKGILDPSIYYYRGVYMDAVRALEVLASLPQVDAARIAVSGGSQGGAITLAAAALSDIPVLAVADYPYLSHFRRAIDISPTGPYLEINDYFRKNSNPQIEVQAMRTLSYFDIMNHASNIRCKTWICVGLIDDITPPSTVFAAYNHIHAEKEIAVYRYFGHEFIPGTVEVKLRLFRDCLQRGSD